MKTLIGIAIVSMMAFTQSASCDNSVPAQKKQEKELTAKDILGKPGYLAVSYGGYHGITRDIQPTVAQLKEDMKLLAVMHVKILRTYNTRLAEAPNLLKAIYELKQEDPFFEMYVMLGAWIDCKKAGTNHPDHHAEDTEANAAEIARAVTLANQYPDIVKIISVGNEAMVKWAVSYYVQPAVILKYVYQLQEMKKSGTLNKDVWVTSSDNFASWGGGSSEYHVDDLTRLYHAVDYVSIHTYPMHDTYYNPDFWGTVAGEETYSGEEKIAAAMIRSREYAIAQYHSVVAYMKSLGIEKPVHIGETGWASSSDGHYGREGSKACDEYKQGWYYKLIREWTNENNIACFCFEAFDEIWKDAANPAGSENHFGLFTIEGRAKYAIWELVDNGSFNGLKRDGNAILKTYDGNLQELMEDTLLPPVMKK